MLNAEILIEGQYEIFGQGVFWLTSNVANCNRKEFVT